MLREDDSVVWVVPIRCGSTALQSLFKSKRQAESGAGELNGEARTADEVEIREFTECTLDFEETGEGIMEDVYAYTASCGKG